MDAGLFGAVVAGAIALGGAGIVALLFVFSGARESSRVQRRLQHGSAVADGGGGGDLLKSLASKGKQVEAMIDTSNESARLLVQAGWRTQSQRAGYYASQIVTPLAMLALFGAAWVLAPAESTHNPKFFLLVIGGVIVSMLLPRMVLRSRAGARVRRIKSEVPLFIHLLVLLFEAGLSTRQAFASMVRDGRGVLPELGKEFELILRQLEAGGDTAEVLNNLSQSLAQEDLSNVLALLRQVDKYGGEVRDPLLETLKVLEERRSLDMREMVNLISGRMTIVMVLCFFPALLIFSAGPAAMSVMKAMSTVNGQ